MNSNCCSTDLGMINGNSIDIIPKNCDTEIKADIMVTEFNSVRLWGQIINCYGQPVPNALLKLVRVEKDCQGKCVYQGIAHSVSDCNGFYQFDLCVDDNTIQYKVLVNKSAIGTERIIEANGGNCGECVTPSYSPCSEYKFRVTPPDHIECSVKKCNNCCENKFAEQTPCMSTHVSGNVYAPSKVRF